MFEDESIPANITFLFEKELARHAVDLDDVRDGRFGELHEHKRARHTWVRARVERDGLQRDLRKL